MRWYGAGGALAIGLVGLLAWLTHDTPPPQEAQPMVVAEVAPAPRAAHPDPAAELMGLNDLDDPPRPHHAAVIDEQNARPSKPITPVAMLTPSSPPPLTSAAGSGAVVRDERPASAVAKHTAAKAGHEPAKSQPTRATAEPARARAPAKQAQTATPAPSTSHGNQARKLAHNAPRARKQAAPAQASRPVVDSDVALISAVIQHSSARAGGECAEPGCAAKTTAQP
jgi:hypothetical protein